jgi:Tfp pilus assembly major pilin PilA
LIATTWGAAHFIPLTSLFLVKAEVATDCAKHANVKAEVAARKTEVATDCAKHANVKAEVATRKTEVATGCAKHVNVKAEVAAGNVNNDRLF